MNLILGSSHAVILSWAAGTFEGDWKTASAGPIRVATKSGAETHIMFATSRPPFVEVTPDGARFGPVMDHIRAFNRPDAKVVLGLGGNEHNTRFLIAQPQPFDFHYPAVPGLDPARQVIPAREMTSILRGLLERTMLMTRLIAGELPQAQRYFLAPPPPIPSDAQIRGNREIFDFSGTGVENARVRLKIYELYLELTRAFCAAAGLTFLPPQHRDAEGFLPEPYWEGSTHANAAYYDGLVTELSL